MVPIVTLCKSISIHLQVTHGNEENCSYLLNYKGGELLNLVHKLFRLLDEEVPLNPSLNVQDKETVAFTLRDALFDVLRLYINLVHDYHQQRKAHFILTDSMNCTRCVNSSAAPLI